MSKIVDIIDGYKILQRSRDYVVCNLNGEYENHGHFSCEDDCYAIINYVRKKKVPKGPYFQEAALRITIDEKYKENILIKQDKNRNKLKYYNCNNGIR